MLEMTSCFSSTSWQTSKKLHILSTVCARFDMIFNNKIMVNTMIYGTEVLHINMTSLYNVLI